MKSDSTNKWFSLLQQVSACLVICAALGLESCANSVQIIADQTTTVRDVGLVGSGTAYVSVDLSGLEGISRKESAEMSSTLSVSVAQALGSSFKQTRTTPDLARVEPDSADLLVLLRAQNPRYPRPWGDISRGWVRVLLVGVLAEFYNIAALDLPARRNDVVLPLAALVLPLYNFLYCYRYESMKGSYSLDYQLSVLKPDGTLLNRRHFTDSATVMVQADVKSTDLRLKDLIAATQVDVSGSVQNYIVADSTTIMSLGEEMKRSYPADCDRILTFKRNVYRVLDESSSRIIPGAGKN